MIGIGFIERFALFLERFRQVQQPRTAAFERISGLSRAFQRGFGGVQQGFRRLAERGLAFRRGAFRQFRGASPGASAANLPLSQAATAEALAERTARALPNVGEAAGSTEGAVPLPTTLVDAAPATGAAAPAHQPAAPPAAAARVVSPAEAEWRRRLEEEPANVEAHVELSKLLLSRLLL